MKVNPGFLTDSVYLDAMLRRQYGKENREEAISFAPFNGNILDLTEITEERYSAVSRQFNPA